MAILGPQISGFVLELVPPSEPLGAQVSAHVQTLLPPNPIEPGSALHALAQTFVPPPEVPPSPIEPPGPLISAGVHDILGATDLAVSAFVHTGLPLE